ncbi:hypothetical protein T459_23160 [Capsicum annuum]|uniref:RRM domain-containing protein n=1 Tax=Capsicum annuum TaxID=4072 RepID=A0A2G2YRS9_CAPAN|nr:hypothetical protein T459_23160 [Capsicum annuum]
MVDYYTLRYFTFHMKERVMKLKAEAKRKRKKEYQEPPKDAKLLIGNLPFDIDSEGLTQLFQQTGVVEITDNVLSRLIEVVSTVEEAEKAVVLYNRYNSVELSEFYY